MSNSTGRSKRKTIDLSDVVDVDTPNEQSNERQLKVPKHLSTSFSSPESPIPFLLGSSSEKSVDLLSRPSLNANQVKIAALNEKTPVSTPSSKRVAVNSGLVSSSQPNKKASSSTVPLPTHDIEGEMVSLLRSIHSEERSTRSSPPRLNAPINPSELLNRANLVALDDNQLAILEKNLKAEKQARETMRQG